MPNSGLLVLTPSETTYAEITEAMQDPKTLTYIFPDQALLGDVFASRWVALPYVYNALRTLRWEGVHGAIWRDGEVRNIHYGLTPKPWEEEERRGKKGEDEDEDEDVLVRRWWEVDGERVREEEERGIPAYPT